MNMLNALFTADFFYSIIRVSTPLIFASLAALISNRAGIINIGIEGTMSFAALFGVLISAATQSALLGLLGAVAVGVLYSLLLGFMTIRLKSHLFLTGIALNLMATGGTVFLLYLACGDKGVSTALPSLALPRITIPLIHRIPVVGSILSNHNIMTYIAFLSVAVLSWILRKTKIGLRINAVGVNEAAVRSVGVNVNKTKYIALLISGILSGLGGAFMSMGYVSFFSANMLAGRGFIGIAAEAMGRGYPLYTMLAALVFGLADAFANVLQMSNLPLQFVQMMPYAYNYHFVHGLRGTASAWEEKQKRLV